MHELDEAKRHNQKQNYDECKFSKTTIPQSLLFPFLGEKSVASRHFFCNFVLAKLVLI